MTAPVSIAGVITFDSFAGTTTDAKMAAMNAWHAGLPPSAPRPAVVFDSKVYTHTVPIELWSGMALVGGRRTAAREYGTGTVLHYTGPNSQLAFVHNTQGYPGDGSPRDITIDAVQFQGGPGVDWMPRNDPSTSSSYAGKVVWMSRFHDCGWNGFRTIWWGWADGAVIDGVTHCQAYSDTPFFLGGSESALFVGGGISYMDSKAPGWASSGKPTIRTMLSKSSIGRVMVTVRQTAYALSIEGGGALDVAGFMADAQDTDPAYGALIRITGGEGTVLRGCSLKGAMTNPTKAGGGAAANGGWIHVAGGTQIAVDMCRFTIAGQSAAPSVPLLYAGPHVQAGQIHWGLSNVTRGFKGPAKIGQAKPGLIGIATYPQLAVVQT